MILAFALHEFPFAPLNAALNGTSAVLLLIAYACIKAKNISAHRALMITALCVSTLFLISYVTSHVVNQVLTRFPATAWRPVYLSILGTHTVLAVVIVPLVIITFLRAQRRQFARHRKIAVWTFPIWLYVSVTGVMIYVMLSASGAYDQARRVQNAGATGSQQVVYHEAR